MDVIKDSTNGVGFVIQEGHDGAGLVVHSDNTVSLVKLDTAEKPLRFMRAVSEVDIPSKPVAFACSEVTWGCPFPFSRELAKRVEEFLTLAQETVAGWAKEHKGQGVTTSHIHVSGSSDIYTLLLPSFLEFYDLIDGKFRARSWKDFIWERRWLKAFGN